MENNNVKPIRFKEPFKKKYISRRGFLESVAGVIGFAYLYNKNQQVDPKETPASLTPKPKEQLTPQKVEKNLAPAQTSPERNNKEELEKRNKRIENIKLIYGCLDEYKGIIFKKLNSVNVDSKNLTQEITKDNYDFLTRIQTNENDDISDISKGIVVTTERNEELFRITVDSNNPNIFNFIPIEENMKQIKLDLSHGSFDSKSNFDHLQIAIDSLPYIVSNNKEMIARRNIVRLRKLN